MLRQVLEIYFIAIRENDPSTSDNWIGSTISAHWDSEHANNDAFLFETLANNYPDIGCPLAFFNLVTGRDLGTLNKTLVDDGVLGRAKKAEEAALKAAKKKAEEAAKEYENKQKCIELEDSSRFLESTVSDLTTESRKMREFATKTVQSIAARVFSVGDYVRVSPDLTLGMLSYGGLGFIVDVDASQYTASIKYGDQDGRACEKNVAYSRITKVPYGVATQSSVTPRPPQKKESVKPNKSTGGLTKEPVLKALRYGFEQRRAKGWRARDLGFEKSSKFRVEAFQRAIADDCRVLQSFFSGIEASGLAMPNRHREKLQNRENEACKENGWCIAPPFVCVYGIRMGSWEELSSSCCQKIGCFSCKRRW